MDESFLGSIDVAIKKAKTARFFNIDTGKLGELTQPGGIIYNIELSNDGLITFPGGVPIKNKKGKIQILVNAINGQQATVGAAYLSRIIQSFNQEIRLDAVPKLAILKFPNSNKQTMTFSKNQNSKRSTFQHFKTFNISQFLNLEISNFQIQKFRNCKIQTNRKLTISKFQNY